MMDHFGLSKSYVWKLFKGLNATFTQRLAFHRVEKAKNLLLQTNEPIYVIAELCGFRNQSRLSEVFFRVVGESPKRFRQHYRPDEIDW
jgi:AraC-like DNA-binding protein